MAQSIANGFAIGKKEDGTPYYWPDSGYGNLAVIGRTGSGKTHNIIANKLLAALQANESVLCFDPKQELQKQFSKAFEKNGFDVRTDDEDTWSTDDKLPFFRPEEIAERKMALFYSEADLDEAWPFAGFVDGIINSTINNDVDNCIVPVHFIFDEFAQMHQIGGAAEAMGLIVKCEISNVDFTLTIQSEGQLKAACGARLARKILYDYSDAQIFLGQGKHGEQLPGNKQELLWMPDFDDILLNLYDYSENPASECL